MQTKEWAEEKKEFIGGLFLGLFLGYVGLSVLYVPSEINRIRAQALVCVGYLDFTRSKDSLRECIEEAFSETEPPEQI